MAIEIMNSGGVEKVKINGEKVREKTNFNTYCYIPNFSAISYTYLGEDVEGIIIDENDERYTLIHSNSGSGYYDFYFSSISGPLPISSGSMNISNFDMTYNLNDKCVYILNEGARAYNSSEYWIVNVLLQIDLNTQTATTIYDDKILGRTSDGLEFSTAQNSEDNFFHNGKLVIVDNELYCVTFLTSEMQVVIRKFNFINKNWEYIKKIEQLATQTFSVLSGFISTSQIFAYQDEIIILSADLTRCFCFDVKTQTGKWRTFYENENQISIFNLTRYFAKNNQNIYQVLKITDDKIYLAACLNYAAEQQSEEGANTKMAQVYYPPNYYYCEGSYSPNLYMNNHYYKMPILYKTE